jgi:anthranilate synthase component II
MRPQVLVVDNYDSFTYNLVHELGCHALDVRVMRNDALDVGAIAASPPAAIVISPGPGTPQRAGRCLELIAALEGRVPTLGVCLGHQAIGQAYGARVTHAGAVVHGQATVVEHHGHILFDGIPARFPAGRYHSLCIDPASLPHELETIATADDIVMAVAHRSSPVYGVQFHPESILTKHGPRVLENFLSIAGLVS